MVAAIFFTVIGVSVVIAVAARAGLKNSSMGEHLVGGRSFPAWLLYFLAVGEIYSIGTMIGLPGGIYEGGASYGVWFVGYILLAYPIGYFLAPLVWRAGVRYDAMTIPDVFGRHFRSRTLEVVTAVALLVALVPWGQYQFVGLQIVLEALGLGISPTQAVVLAAVIAFLYLVVSGVRSPAFVSILKDSLMMLGIVVVGVVAVVEAGGVDQTFSAPEIPRSMVTLSGSPMVYALSTIAFQSVVFYLGFSAAYVFTAKSERAIKSSTVWMPLYMMMYPFLFAASFFAIASVKVDDPNTAFMEVTTTVLPEWMVGVVAAGAGLSGILVLAVTALTIGGIVTRNLVPGVKAGAQRRISNVVVALFLVVAAWLTLQGSELMLTLLTLFYYLLGQVVPGWVAVMFFPRVRAWAVGLGIVVGVVTSWWLYDTGADLWGLNPGLVATAVNACIVGVGSLLGGREGRAPMVRWPSGSVEPEYAVDLDGGQEVSA